MVMAPGSWAQLSGPCPDPAREGFFIELKSSAMIKLKIFHNSPSSPATQKLTDDTTFRPRYKSLQKTENWTANSSSSSANVWKIWSLSKINNNTCCLLPTRRKLNRRRWEQNRCHALCDFFYLFRRPLSFWPCDLAIASQTEMALRFLGQTFFKAAVLQGIKETVQS